MNRAGPKTRNWRFAEPPHPYIYISRLCYVRICGWSTEHAFTVDWYISAHEQQCKTDARLLNIVIIAY